MATLREIISVSGITTPNFLCWTTGITAIRQKGDTNGTMLGETQLVWLKNKLLMSDAAFKFICLGSTVLNENNMVGESYTQYPKERSELLDFIADNNIKGVVFFNW